MRIIIEAEPKEIAALVAGRQERKEEVKYALVRKPYQRNYSLVKVGLGRELPLEAK